jgi:hypothetical protein
VNTTTRAFALVRWCRIPTVARDTFARGELVLETAPPPSPLDAVVTFVGISKFCD